MLGSFGAWSGLAASILVFSSLPAANPTFTFKVRNGDKIAYDIEQQTTVRIVAGDEKSSIASTTRIRHEWNVVQVHPDGDADMVLTIERLSVEETDPAGKVIKFDSTKPEESHAALREQLGKLVGKPVLRVRMQPDGQVKSSENLTDQKSLSRDLPFLIAFAGEPVQAGSKWERPLVLTLDPPLGSGQKFDALQSCQVHSMSSDEIVIGCQTRLKQNDAKPDEKLALAQFMMKGTMTLDRRKGLLASASLEVDETFPEFDGPGTSYQFKNTYTSKLVESAAIQADRRKP